MKNKIQNSWLKRIGYCITLLALIAPFSSFGAGCGYFCQNNQHIDGSCSVQPGGGGSCGGQCTFYTFRDPCGRCASIEEYWSPLGQASQNSCSKCTISPFTTICTTQVGACKFKWIFFCDCPSEYPTGTQQEVTCECNTTGTCCG
jgi:hypothetical protein